MLPLTPYLMLFLASIILGGCQTEDSTVVAVPAVTTPVTVATPVMDEKQPIVTPLEEAPLIAQPVLPAPSLMKTSVAAESAATLPPKAHLVPRPRPQAGQTFDHRLYPPPANIVVANANAPSTPSKPAQAAPKAAVDDRLGVIVGQVEMQAKGKPVPLDEVMIAVEPLTVGLIQPRAPKRWVMTMRDKTYSPTHLLVQVGDSIEFSNEDHFKHNVFSSSQPNIFDLGTYGPEKKPQVTLTHPGLVKVYCNIHPKMAAFVLVSAVDRMTLTDKTGRFRLEDLPPGRYRLTAWNIRADWQQEITLLAGQSLPVTIHLDASQYQPKPHLNKLGKPYPPEKVSFDDDDELY